VSLLSSVTSRAAFSGRIRKTGSQANAWVTGGGKFSLWIQARGPRIRLIS